MDWLSIIGVITLIIVGLVVTLFALAIIAFLTIGIPVETAPIEEEQE